MSLYTGPQACAAAGITYRQLDYWARTGLVQPSTPAGGSGTQRAYSRDDVVTLRIVKVLLSLGVTLTAARQMVEDSTDVLLIGTDVTLAEVRLHPQAIGAQVDAALAAGTKLRSVTG